MSNQCQKITIFGMGGFIGSAISNNLTTLGYEVNRGDWKVRDFNQQYLGDVIVACGVGDCRKVEEVIYSHVDVVRNIVNSSTYNRIIYISSTRVYLDNHESNPYGSLLISPNDKRVLFNQVKLLAETIIQSQEKPALILRPSNVYGKAFNSPLFLPSIIRDAIQKRAVNMYVTPDYSKDYVYCDDICRAVAIGIKNKISGVYNIASGENFSAGEIAAILKSKINTDIIWHENAALDKFPVIDINDSVKDFGFQPVKVKEMLNEMIDDFTHEFNS
ncbi:NAD(P)-dependent oxidoreductase [Pantoea alhagi]|uniref:NAD-dependent epimerase/dehydratase family protein n=1 Tax=Pantoea alhagi TaxID=1891675 RepID=UPI00202B9E69|nr:NAD(P)-dependent oxidoreductase [Pantoea alhagi]URQ59614.1 NAD(P)-dependent oxidoreductase [Pantoea alhagi]